jgi:hypothetical protein
MDLVWNEVKTRFKKIPTPAGDYYTGVPVDDLRAWLANRYNEIEPLVTEFQDAIDDSLYLQATVGIIPSALRDLHREYVAEEPGDRDVMQAVADAANTWVDAIVKKMLDLNDEYVKDLSTAPTGAFSSMSSKQTAIDLEAFKGVMHLCQMYVIGSALNQTNLFEGSTQKNAVMFLSKMNLGSVRRGAMTKYQGGFFSSAPPASTITLIANGLSLCPLSKVDYWVGKGLSDRRGQPERGPFIANVETFVRGVFTGEQVQAVNTGLSRQLNIDEMPAAVRDASAGQQGIPVEYRYIKLKPKPAQLAAALLRIVRDVRRLNTKHMAADQRDALIAAADR